MRPKTISTLSKSLLVPIILLFGAGFGSKTYAQTEQSYEYTDTLFKKMTIDQLIEIRKHYDSKVGEYRTREEQTQDRGMEWSESFLKEKAGRIEDRDKVYIRLAEYYIEEEYERYNKAVDAYDSLFVEYEKQLKRYDAGELEEQPEPPKFPDYNFSEAIAVYDRILNEYPSSEYADDALYNKAWLLDHMGKGQRGRRIFQEVINKYPESKFAPESYMQLAEYFFSPRDDKTEEGQIIVELQKAIQLYKNVLKYKNTRRYDEALYKLGWSYYKLAARNPRYYADAITYFMAVVDDINRAKELDPRGKISNQLVRDEAIEYIGISFTDEAFTENGVDKASELMDRIGDRPYGPEIFQAIGETFQNIDEPKKAIYAYETLLDRYPRYHQAPQIQKNVVDALYTMGQDRQAYLARQDLYEGYSPKSDWYAHIDQAEQQNKISYLDKAYELSEQALRTNILLDLEAAEEMVSKGEPAIEQYETFADHCSKYLNTFPSDSNAYDINWSYAYMLDSRLGRFDQAYEEYIRVSNDYLETEHQHEAALNAVYTADTLVEMKYGTQEKGLAEIDIANAARLSPESLTDEERRLIEAYDNYIRLFPDGEYTPNFLAAAGGIYYNHKKFAEAKVYFQTLVSRFPGAEQKSLALRSIMDSYFALGKFKDSEIMAKRILDEVAVSEEQKDFARKRMGQAIFKNAEYLEDQGDYFAAANEYKRVYKEASEDQQLAEAALFNAGLNYERVKDWVRAINVFDTLAVVYPDSRYALPSLEKMAGAYTELEQFTQAAQIYERIYNKFSDAENAEPALYNASYYYQKGENWQDAIRVNTEYIEQYPDKSYATDLFFTNAKLYLKMDNVQEANRIYEAFANRFPDDPRTVTAFYERGKYYMDNGRIEEAKAEFNKAINRSENFREQGKDPNAYIAAEAVNALADILHDEFVAIELEPPQSNIESKMTEMRDLLTELNDAYRKVVSFASPRSFEAVYNIARSYEEFADIYANQQIDPSLNQDERFVQRQKINQQASKLYDRAVEEYQNVVDKLPAVAERLGVDLTSAPASEDTAAVLASVDTTQQSGISRATEVDSTRKIAVKYYSKAQDKISELLYTEAHLLAENVYQAVDVQAPSNDPVKNLIYNLTVLQKVASPAIQKTMDAHMHNMERSHELGLSNKYVEESKRQILLTSNIMAKEIEDLVHEALDQYVSKRDEIKEMIKMEYGATNEQGMDYLALDNVASQMLDYVKILSREIINSYAKTLTIAREKGIKNDLVKSTEDHMLRHAVEITDTMTVLAAEAQQTSERYRAIFDSTQNYNYDDGALFFENYYFDLTDFARGIMDLAFQKQQEFEIDNLWANKLLLKLIKLDPMAYSESVEREKLHIITDDSWKYNKTYFAGKWNLMDFDDSDWKNAAIVDAYDSADPFLGLDLEKEPFNIWIRTEETVTPTPTTVPDSLNYVGGDTLQETLPADTAMLTTDTLQSTTEDTMLALGETSESDTIAFFRKIFTLNGQPMNGKIFVTADDDYRVYLNGEYLIDDEANQYAVLDSLDYYTLEIAIKQGQNILAVDVEDKDLTGKGLKLYAVFEYLPTDIESEQAKRAKVREIIVDPEVLQRVNILNKNRISLKQ